MATMPLAGLPPLEVHGARRAFGAGRGLDGVDLRLARGEIYGLLGPNGAGKTSLVRAICGRLRLDAGSVSLLGRDPGDAEARRGLGLVPQEIALYPELTVAENLELLGRLAGLPGGEAGPAVRDALGWIGLADRAASLVATLSGGQQRRVNLAAATLHRPAVLLLDEPTVGVDPAAREQIHERLRDLGARGIAILLATHDLDQAAELCGRIGILVDGRIRAEGTLAELVRRAFGDAREIRVSLASPRETTRGGPSRPRVSPPGRTPGRGRAPSRSASTRSRRSPGGWPPPASRWPSCACASRGCAGPSSA